MSMLKVRCAKCNTLIPTGFEMSYEAYKSATLQQHTLECPNCEHMQTWTLDDVERSTIPPPK